jgi:chromatin remodeling complex protein RSC6
MPDENPDNQPAAVEEPKPATRAERIEAEFKRRLVMGTSLKKDKLTQASEAQIDYEDAQAAEAVRSAKAKADADDAALELATRPPKKK